MPTEKKYEINELTDTESTADAGNMLNGKAVVDEPTVTEFTETPNGAAERLCWLTPAV